MASLFRNIARKNFVNCLEAGNVRSLLSTGHRFVKRENVTRVTSHLSISVDPHKRESHRKRSRNSPYSLFAVLGIAAASSNDTEENVSPPTLSVSDSLSAPSFPRSLHEKRSTNRRFTKAAKGTPKNLIKMGQGYQKYTAKRKLNFENYTDENQPPSKRNTRGTQVCTPVTRYL